MPLNKSPSKKAIEGNINTENENTRKDIIELVKPYFHKECEDTDISIKTVLIADYAFHFCSTQKS